MEGSRDGPPRQPRRPKRSWSPVEASGSPARAKRSSTSTARQPCEHPGHHTVPVDEARGGHGESCRIAGGKPIKYSKKTQQTEREKLRRDLKWLRQRAKDATDHCESILVNVIDSLQRGYCKVKEIIEAREPEAAAQIQHSLQSPELQMGETRKRDVEPHHLANRHLGDACVMQNHPSRAPLSESERAPAVSEEPFTQLLEPIEEAVESLGGDWRTSVMRKSPQSAKLFTPTELHTVLGSFVRLSDAYELTLDQNTAHKCLDVSNGDKEVQRSPPKECRQVLPTPARFSLRVQVLCREALPAGRCYYEVEVDGDQAEIGLTYKGIHRKSLTSSSAFGGNDKSWSLDCSNGYSVSHRDKVVQLTAARRHRRIGVFLKSREGTLSFYEVSEVVELLYTVETTFEEPLYAGFRLGENCRIRLCDQRREEP
ncbi:tripartite motif-containing protein 16-like [Lampris incognitus]|uniref:tripartite motif-containing protein 16-like n=1 Tax=Lampris incognitus TaxID=2546036 RepID=UPI0024B59F69|nr:tripartite motif-containing protein 16-like [Lampris incognitus]